MLPHGHIELKFQNNEIDLQLAHDLLSNYKTSQNNKDLTLIITKDGSLKQMADILNLLENAKIHIAEFAQKLPTLEDVFLTIIGENQRKENVS